MSATPRRSALVALIVALPLGDALGTQTPSDPGPPTPAVRGTMETSSDANALTPVAFETTRRATRGFDRVDIAVPLRAGDAVLGANTDYFTARSMFQASDRHRRVAWFGVLGLSTFGPLDLALGWSTTSNANSPGLSDPARTLGDPTILAKGSFALTRALAAGASMQLGVPTSEDGTRLALDAFTLTSLAIASFAPTANAVVALNAGYRIDHSRKLFAVEPPVEIGSLIRFSAGVAKRDTAIVALGALYRVPVAEALRLSPYVELDGAFAPGAASRENPLRATLGATAVLGARGVFELTVAGAYRLRGAPVSDGTLPGLPPWELHAGFAIRMAAFGQSPAATSATGGASALPRCVTSASCPSGQSCLEGQCTLVKEVDKEVVREVVRPPPVFFLAGTVTSSADQRPVADATVKLSGFEGVVLASGKDGKWKSWPLPLDDGILKVSVTAAGFRPAEQMTPKGPANETKQLTLALTPTDKAVPSQLRVQLKDRATGKSVGGLVTIPSLGKKLPVAGTGTLETELPAGRYNLIVSSPHLQTQSKEITLVPGELVILNLDLGKSR